MKKNLLYLLALAVVAAVVFFILNQKKEEIKISSDQEFAVEDVAVVERIVLSNKNAKADLRREADHWKINGKYKVMQPKMDVLLETLKKIRVEYPVSKAATKNAANELAAKSVRVELYHKDEDKPFKVYYVGGATQDSKGTFMRMELNGAPAEKIYVMHIPGFTGLLDVRYFTEEIEWRDTGIFDYEMDDIAQVSVQYPMQQQFSFNLVAVNADSFIITQPANYTSAVSDKIYKEGVVKYLSSFDFLNAEMYDNGNPKKDSITNEMPYATVMATDRNGNSKQMTVFYMPLNKRSKSQFDREGKHLPYDIDKFYAVINDEKDFVIIQNFVFGKIFRKHSDFYLQR
ncbi:MAG: DUF4340 domain-containing protein [Chitinophagales bacterium]|nr:DUF4340 domain-containing protein [Chitinophagales bacterium]